MINDKGTMHLLLTVIVGVLIALAIYTIIMWLLFRTYKQQLINNITNDIENKLSSIIKNTENDIISIINRFRNPANQ